MVYLLSAEIFPPESKLVEGGRSPPLNRYKKVQKRFIRKNEKNDNDKKIKVG